MYYETNKSRQMEAKIVEIAANKGSQIETKSQVSEETTPVKYAMNSVKTNDKYRWEEDCNLRQNKKWLNECNIKCLLPSDRYDREEKSAWLSMENAESRILSSSQNSVNTASSGW